MKKKYIALSATLAVVIIAGGVIGGHAVAQSVGGIPPVATPSFTPVQESKKPTVLAPPDFSTPTPKPTTPPAETTEGTTPGTVVDADGNVTITPDWEAKHANAQIAAKEPTANMGGSGGSSLDLKDGVYQGDHPGEATPTPKPTPKPTPAPTAAPTAKPQKPADPTPTPKPTPKPTKPSTDDGNHKDGEISSDGKYEYWAGFGWVERGEGSYGTPGSNVGGTELSGEKVGNM